MSATDSTTDDKHRATHAIDDGCSRIAATCIEMIAAAGVLHADAELARIMSACETLELRAMTVHRELFPLHTH